MCLGDTFHLKPAGWAAGFHFSDTYRIEIFATDEKEHVWSNLANILSWIPFFSIISGSYYWNRANELASRSEGSNKEGYINALRARAIASFCQASVILFALDIIATLCRYCPCGHSESCAYELVVK